MRVAVCAPHVPLASGGMERLTQDLWRELRRRGHAADLVRLPYTPYSRAAVLRGVVAWRLADLQPWGAYGVDMVIATAFPSYFVRHPCKVTWLIAQYRQAYDLNQTDWADAEWLRDESWRAAVTQSDRVAIGESKAIYSISANVSDRLRQYNGLEATPLHPPPPLVREPSSEFGDVVLAVGRLDGLKRHDLLIDAMQHVEAPARCVIVGTGVDRDALQARIDDAGLGDRVRLAGWVDDDELRRLYGVARVVFYGPLDEDLGLVAMEALAAGKPVISLRDSGGVLEFVSDGVTGWVVEHDARAVARAIDAAFFDDAQCRALGAAGHELVAPMTWDRVIDALLQPAC
jgi:glycosyltransferase involved in cell wall biosynthesis